MPETFCQIPTVCRSNWQETGAANAAEPSSWQPALRSTKQSPSLKLVTSRMWQVTSTTSSRTWLESWPRAAESDSKA